MQCRISMTLRSRDTKVDDDQHKVAADGVAHRTLQRTSSLLRKGGLGNLHKMLD